MADKFDIEEFWNRLVHSGEHESEPVISEEFDRKYPDLVKLLPSYPVGYAAGALRADISDKRGYTAGLKSLYDNYRKFSPLKVNDKYKHAMINCLAAQNGRKFEKTAALLSLLKEQKDVLFNQNTVQESDADYLANVYGREVGRNNPLGDCDELVKKRFKP